MEPPRERFERSIPDQEERMKDLLHSFKAEVVEKFQEQEKRIAEQEERIARQEEKNVKQDEKIARQSKTILKLEKTIAEQQKTIEEQNETIQMITTHPDLLQGFQTILSEDSGDNVISNTSHSNCFTVTHPENPRHSVQGSLHLRAG